MIHFCHGNILKADAEALVNTVNCVGVMGKGLALQFKHRFPKNFIAYRQACERNTVVPGKMFVFHRGIINPKYVVNFPTKRHWKDDSRLCDIESGLIALVRWVKISQTASIAIPPLGCGNGHLKWDEVRPRIMKAFQRLPKVTVLLFSPP